MTYFMPAKYPCSLVLITLNAASQLEATLKSAAFCEDIVIVDSGSTDETALIAEKYGARFIFEAWQGFGLQKQLAVNHAKFDWVLCVDADECVSLELKESIINALQNPQFNAYKMARCNRFLGRYLRHGEAYPDFNLRFFNRKNARWSEDSVHEHVLTNEKIGVLGGDLIHDSAETLERYLTKQNRYTSLAAARAIEKGQQANALQLFLSPLFRFFKFYVLRRGFLDGKAGFIHIVIGCFNSFMKYAKMLEIQQIQQNTKEK